MMNVMISRLEGEIALVAPKYAVLDVSGVGYKLFLPNDILSQWKGKEGDRTEVWTHLSVRENALDLYGFVTVRDLEFFELLLTVSGVGPKSALGILNSATPDMVIEAVTANDASYLTKASGIGAKSAQKIVLELKDKIGSLSTTDQTKNLSSPEFKKEMEVLEALEALGYSMRDARDAVKQVPPEVESPSERVREALKLLGKN